MTYRSSSRYGPAAKPAFMPTFTCGEAVACNAAVRARARPQGNLWKHVMAEKASHLTTERAGDVCDAKAGAHGRLNAQG